jgi:hypothetical protein
MRLVTYARAGSQVAGLLLGDQVLDLVAAGKRCGELVIAGISDLGELRNRIVEV